MIVIRIRVRINLGFVPQAVIVDHSHYLSRVLLAYYHVLVRDCRDGSAARVRATRMTSSRLPLDSQRCKPRALPTFYFLLSTFSLLGTDPKDFSQPRESLQML